jgi:ankyrin repeat protein
VNFSTSYAQGHGVRRSNLEKLIYILIYFTVDLEGNTPLHVASQKNFFLIVEALLDAGADITAINNRVSPPPRPSPSFSPYPPRAI